MGRKISDQNNQKGNVMKTRERVRERWGGGASTIKRFLVNPALIGV